MTATTATVSSMDFGSIANGDSNGRGKAVWTPSTVNSAAGTPPGGLRHNPGVSVDWTAEEQSKLEVLLTQYASETPVDRYAKISAILRDKTIRDVALRCTWMSDQEKAVVVSSNPSNALSTYNDDVISAKAIGGAVGQILEQNAQLYDQISANLGAEKLKENLDLFHRARANIFSILYGHEYSCYTDESSGLKQMPPLPCTVNEELANFVLGPPSEPNQP